MMKRVLGAARAEAPGPTVVGIGGLHGNEPAGLEGLRRVLAGMRRAGGPRRGEFVALAGNLSALRVGRRYLHRDLNRIWNGAPAGDGTEARERAELERVLDEIRARARGPLFLIDLHTTSGETPPFVTVSSHPEARSLARSLPVPLVMGLTPRMPGTLMEHASRRGWAAVAFEAGSHGDPASSRRTEAALTLVLRGRGLLNGGAVPGSAARRSLERTSRGLPPVVRVVHRHPVSPGSGFRMRAGFRSFQEIRQGDLLARERSGEVRAPRSGRLLMPLYQEWGEDGFFVVEPGSEG